MRPLTVAALLLFTLPLAADDKADREKRVADLKAKIADAERTASALKAELAKLQAADPPLKNLTAPDIRVGDIGVLKASEVGGVDECHQKVIRILGERSVLTRANAEDRSSLIVILRGYSTEKLADDVQFTMPPTFKWKVTGKEKVGAGTYFVLEPVK